MEVAHSLPFINRNGLGLSLIGLEKTGKTAINKNVNVEHQVIKNLNNPHIDVPVDDDGNPVSRIIGHVVAQEIGGEPMNEMVAIPTDGSRPVFFVTALHRAEPFVQAVHEDILDSNMAGRPSRFGASVEFSRIDGFGDDLIFDGEKQVSFADADKDLLDKMLTFNFAPIQHNGRVAGLVPGGNRGVNFSGLAITINPADVKTGPREVAASTKEGQDDASRMLASLVFLQSQGEQKMDTSAMIELLCTVGALEGEKAKSARTLAALLNTNEEKTGSKKFDAAEEKLAEILASIKTADAERAITDKVDEKLASGDFIKADDLNSKVEAAIKEQVEKGDLFTKESFENAVKAKIDTLNASVKKVDEMLNTLKEAGIDVEKLDKAMQGMASKKGLREQLNTLANGENCDERFKGAVDFYKTLAKGAEALNSNVKKDDSLPPLAGASVASYSESEEDFYNMF